MAQSIEQVMKEIHLLFSKCKQYHAKEDMIIVPKRRVFDLLQELNYAVSEMMDEYGATQRSRDIALKRFQEQKEKIEKESTRVSEDIYAAAMLYTDRMLLDLKAAVEKAGKDIQKEYEFLASQLESQVALIGEDQQELRNQLMILEQGQKYKDIIEKYNDQIDRQREEERRKELEKQKETENEQATTKEESILKESPVVKEKKDKKQDITEKDPEEIVVSEWKQREEHEKTSYVGVKPKGIMETFFPDKGIIQTENEQIRVKKRSFMSEQPFAYRTQVRTVGSVVDESALEPIEERGNLDDAPKKVSYEIKVNQSWHSETSGMDSQELDKEYYQWKEEREKDLEKDKEGFTDTEPKKKEKRFLFGHKKTDKD